MFGIETPMGRTPFQGASLDGTSPRAKDLGYSVRPPRGHRKMSKLQDQHVGRKIRPSGNHEITRAKPLVSEQRKPSLPKQFPDLITSDSPTKGAGGGRSRSLLVSVPVVTFARRSNALFRRIRPVVA